MESVFDLQEFRSSEHRLALVLLQILVLRLGRASPTSWAFTPDGRKACFSGLCSDRRFSVITLFRTGTPNTLSDSPGFLCTI